jgi:hypothetical protein
MLNCMTRSIDRQSLDSAQQQVQQADGHLPKLPSLCERIIILWDKELELRVSARTDKKLTKDYSPLEEATASNYRRHVKNCLLKINAEASGLEKLSEEELFNKVSAYLEVINKRNAATGRGVRSALLGQFIPWCEKQGLLPIDVSRYQSLLPLPFVNFSAPLVEKFLDSQKKLPSEQTHSLELQRGYLRALYRALALEKLGFTFAQLRANARNLMIQELQTGASLAELDPTRNQLATGRPPASVSELILRDRNCINSYLTTIKSAEEGAQIREFFCEYRNWLIVQVQQAMPQIRTGEVAELPLLNSEPEVNERNVLEQQVALPSFAELEVIPKRALSILSERRASYSALYQESLHTRDQLIDCLIRDCGCSLAELVSLRRTNLSKDVTEQYRLVLQGRTVYLDSEQTVMMGRYLKQRQIALRELGIDSSSKKLPLLISADGGSLVVYEGAVKEKKPISSLQALQKGMTLIQELITFEQLSFTELRAMPMDTLQELSFSRAASRELRDAYIRTLQVSPLRFFSISREGPCLAFPAADGDLLTADREG